MGSQSRRHGRCPRPPPRDRATTVGDCGSRPRLAKAHVGQYAVVIDVQQRQLISHARFALAERVDPAPDRRHALAHIEGEPCDTRRLDRPASSRPPLLDGQPGAEDHAVLDPHETSTPGRLHDVSLEQLGQRHPTRLRSWTFVLAPCGLHPGATMRAQCRGVVLEAIRQQQRHTP